MNEKRIAWAITGAGHVLEECIETALNCRRVDIFLSRAAEEVLRMYRLDARITIPRIRIYEETKSSAPIVTRLSVGAYSVLVVAPGGEICVWHFRQPGHQFIRPGRQVARAGNCLSYRPGAGNGFHGSSSGTYQSLSAAD
jgi:hypothetical protein